MEAGGNRRVTARGVRFKVGEHTLVPLPRLSWDLKEHSVFLRRLAFGHSHKFGDEVRSTWNLYQLGEPLVAHPRRLDSLDEWSDLTLRLDYLEKRGLATGLDFDYLKPTYQGDFTSFYIRDRGEDVISGPPPRDDRGRAEWWHRQHFGEALTLDIESAYLSDRGFLREYFEQEFKEAKDKETVAYLRHQRGVYQSTLLGRLRLNDFLTRTEYVPRVGLNLIGLSFLDDRLTLTSESQVANVRVRPDDATGFPSPRALRADSANELSLPLNISLLKVVPFAGLGYTFYDQTPAGGGDARFAGAAGVRASTQFWRTFEVQSEVLHLHGLRHIMRPEVGYLNYYSVNLEADELDQYDTVDGLWELEVLSLGLKQKLQTRRVVPEEEGGGKETIDWLMLGASINHFGRRPSAVTQEQLSQMQFTHGVKPLLYRGGGGRDFSDLKVDFKLRLAEGLALVSDVEINVEDTSEVDILRAGVSVSRLPGLALYLGNHYLREIDSSNVVVDMDCVINPRWSVGFMEQYDFSASKLIEAQVSLRRRFHCWTLELTYGRDEGEDNTMFGVSFVPGRPKVTRQRLF